MMTDAERIAALEARLEVEMRRLDQAIEVARERTVSLADNREKALDQLRESVTARFLQVNEFRGALADLGATMATRRELDAFKEQYAEAHEALREQVAIAGRRIDLNAGKSEGVTATTKIVVTVISTLLLIVGAYTAVQASRTPTPATVTTTTTTTVTIP